MKILVISSFLPYPLFSGGHIRLYNLIKQLSQKHEITLVCEKRSHQTIDDIKQVQKICKAVITVDRKNQWSIKNITKTAFSSFSFLLTGHFHKEMQQKIREYMLLETFDVIHVETSYVFQNLPENTTVPTVLVEHNIEYLVYKRFAKTAPFFLQPFLYVDIQKLRYWEEKFWKKATKLVAVSEAEKKLMKRNDVAIVPNGVDTEKFAVHSSRFTVRKREKKILFIGDFKWVQNKDAVRWILKEIWPSFGRLRRSLAGKPQIKLWIVGRSIPYAIKKLATDKNVIFDQNASDTAEIFAKADVLLAPIRVGGGTSFKILEAMASGVPVITTPLGVEGLWAKDGKEILVAHTVKDFSDLLTAILEDNTFYKKISENARKLIEEKYDWKIIANQLEDVYLSAL